MNASTPPEFPKTGAQTQPARHGKSAKLKRAKRQPSPIVRFCRLAIQIERQPFGLPNTPEQFDAYERLAMEVVAELEYRRIHPDWREEGRWT